MIARTSIDRVHRERRACGEEEGKTGTREDGAIADYDVEECIAGRNVEDPGLCGVEG